MRRLSRFDRLLTEVQHCFTTLSHSIPSHRPSPAQFVLSPSLCPDEIRKSQGYMRVNHTGEICAQALYRGQAFATSTPALQAHLHQAAEEEADHLVWCKNRLEDLTTHTSYLNLFWYTSSFLLGWITAKQSDAISLGFVVETETQVLAHLESHQRLLPLSDHPSRAIVSIMIEDEAHHAQEAQSLGAQALSPLFKQLMALQSYVMTHTAYWI